MSNVVVIRDFRKEISDLEDQKWDILLKHGESVAIVMWERLDARLVKLYEWWVTDMYAKGRERELPFHMRKHT